MLRLMTALYLLDGPHILLLYRVGSRVVAPSWCGIGGHFEPEDSADPTACVLRELREETGIGPDRLTDLQLRYITLRLKNGEVRQNHYFFAELRDPGLPLPACTEGELRWFPLAETAALEMPVTARHCLAHYRQTGHATRLLYTGGATPEGIRFTPLTEF